MFKYMKWKNKGRHNSELNKASNHNERIYVNGKISKEISSPYNLQAFFQKKFYQKKRQEFLWENLPCEN